MYCTNFTYDKDDDYYGGGGGDDVHDDDDDACLVQVILTLRNENQSNIVQ